MKVEASLTRTYPTMFLHAEAVQALPSPSEIRVGESVLRITEDQLTRMLFNRGCGHEFKGTKADARLIARTMLDRLQERAS